MAKSKSSKAPSKSLQPSDAGQLDTGRGGKDNFPTSPARRCRADPVTVSAIMSEVTQEYRQPRVRSDAELMQRITDYFNRCAGQGRPPVWEELCVSTGYTITTVWDWANGRNRGFSGETSKIIKRAKDFLQTFDAKLVVAGYMDFTTYCFRAKNYYGMADQREIVVSPAMPLDTPDAATIAAKYDELPD